MDNFNLFCVNDRNFFTGCNYLASHAGIFMWRNWDEMTVDRDLQLLAENNINVLRVFPLWPDFQPLTEHNGCFQVHYEWRMGEDPLPDTDFGRAGIDAVMMERFHRFVGLAQKHGFKLIVAFLAGWMSGRMFAPPALERRKLMTDPVAVYWETRFIRAFIRSFKDDPAIVAWEPGNECECLENCSLQERWSWFNTIGAVIKAADPARPVLSGTNITLESTWRDSNTISDMAEAVDVLSPHVYTIFAPHGNNEPLTGLRSLFQSCAITRCCADISGKPAFIEEIGGFNHTHNDSQVSAAYMENMLWNSYVHHCRGALWWCAFDSNKLTQTPYDWASMERRLGLITADGQPKPVMRKMRAFAEFAKEHPLPEFTRNAVCILTTEQDSWAAAFLSWVLAKQANFDLEFQFAYQPLKEASLYLVPSVRSYQMMRKCDYDRLLERVANGASLYLSATDSGIEPFEPFGAEIKTIAETAQPAKIYSKHCGLDFELPAEFRISLNRNDCDEVIATDRDGEPAFTRNAYGKGQMIFLNVPLENMLANSKNAFGPDSAAYYKIYEIIARIAGVRRLVRRKNPLLTLTEHIESARSVLIGAVNNSAVPVAEQLEIAAGWTVRECFNGKYENGILTLSGHTGALLRLVEKAAETD